MNSNNKFKVLIVEDEDNIRTFVKTILETNGYQVLEACSSNEGKMMFLSYSPDIIILDLGLPDGDGLDFIKMIRETLSVPIIVLSARTDETDKVAALDLGANDYVTKPFGTAELLARLRAALRSSHQRLNQGLEENKKFRNGELEIDYEFRRVTVNKTEIKLTQTEYNILALLASNAGKVMTYAEIIKKIWIVSDPGSVKRLQVNLANIRKKIGEKPGQNKYIMNELGVGYRMENPEEA